MLFLMVAVSAFAENSPSLSFSWDKGFFNPTAGECARLTVSGISPSTPIDPLVLVDLCGRTVAVLRAAVETKDDHASYVWDGRNLDGQIVSDDVYSPAGFPAFPASQSLEVHVNREEGWLEYTLPVPARVTARAGLVEGPVLRILANKQPQTAGLHRLAWDGWDKEKTIDILGHPKHQISIMYQALPEGCIVTTGHVAAAQAPCGVESITQKIEHVQGAPSFKGEGVDLSNAFALDFLPAQPDAAFVTFTGQTCAVQFRALLPWMAQCPEGFWEAYFFVDGRFTREEVITNFPCVFELPIPGQFPGEHHLSVNLVTPFSGMMGIRNVRFNAKSDSSTGGSHELAQ